MKNNVNYYKDRMLTEIRKLCVQALKHGSVSNIQALTVLDLYVSVYGELPDDMRKLRKQLLDKLTL